MNSKVHKENCSFMQRDDGVCSCGFFDTTIDTKKWDNAFEKYYKKTDKDTKHGLPSDRIKFLCKGTLCCYPESKWLKAIMDYIDEEYEKEKY